MQEVFGIIAHFKNAFRGTFDKYLMYLQNKYTNIYNLIIARATNRVLTTYYEKHHIIPQSIGGTDDPVNIVNLTAREHFICHLLLTKMVVGAKKSKMHQAVWMMASCSSKNQERYKINNRLYEQLKLNMSSVKKSITTWNKGITPKNETRLKLRSASNAKLVLTGKITQEEADRRNGLPLQEVKRYGKRKPKKAKELKGRSKGGWKWSDEDKARLSAQRIGRTPWNKGRSSKQS